MSKRHRRRRTMGIRASVLSLLLASCFLFDKPVCRAQMSVGQQSRPEYFVDILVISDAPIYQAWFARQEGGGSRREDTLSELRQYFTLLIQEANRRYRTLENYNNFRLSLRPVGFHIAERVDQSPWTSGVVEAGSGQVEADRVLDRLTTWLVNTGPLPTHDHVVLLSGYDIVTRDSGRVQQYVVGQARVGTLCGRGGGSVSVVEDRGGFQSALTIAHELGHSLGAGHDGTGGSCSASDHFIMAPGRQSRTPTNSSNPWFFSECSAREIHTHVNALLDTRVGRECLANTAPQIGVPDVESLIPGQLYTPDQQCQHILGPQSRYCYGGHFGPLEAICTSMFCLAPDDRRRNVCLQYHAAHGTSCGPGKWCESGACVTNAKAPKARLGECAFGDQLVLVNRRSCLEAVMARPSLCRDRQVRTVCCASCAKRQPAARGCPFSDRTPGCRAGLCSTLLPDATPYARVCCRTCSSYVTYLTCADNSKGRDALTCKMAVGKGCDYGDMAPRLCENMSLKTTRTCSPQLRSQCCHTCNQIDARNSDLSDAMMSSSSSGRVYIQNPDVFIASLVGCAFIFWVSLVFPVS